uniref:Cilia- and flagella-associated protein 251-like n=1 Tax=Diabrotica virgifera virgifera TaxID=50390 RepID=A0A6P7FRQ4_DIAVI
MGEKDDEHRQNIQENEKENDSKPNREEQSLDDFRKDGEEEMTSFEKELISTHNERRRMNRSTVQKQSTLVGETIDLEESENDEEDIGEEKSQEDTEEMEEGWRNALQESVLSIVLLEEERDGGSINTKKRKGDSIERINDLKREGLEKSIKFPNETRKEKINRKLQELFEKVSDKLGEGMDTEIRKLFGIIKSTNNKIDDSIDEINKTHGDTKCEQCKLKVERKNRKKNKKELQRHYIWGEGK